MEKWKVVDRCKGSELTVQFDLIDQEGSEEYPCLDYLLESFRSHEPGTLVYFSYPPDEWFKEFGQRELGMDSEKAYAVLDEAKDVSFLNARIPGRLELVEEVVQVSGLGRGLAELMELLSA